MSGAGGSFRTELPEMQSASQHVYDVNGQIQSELSSLLARLEPLMSTWQGEAATSFQTLKERWHQDATQLNAALRGIGDGIKQAHGNYQSVEEQTHQSMTSLTSRLGG
jgi:WXG100 family type VII secretion target